MADDTPTTDAKLRTTAMPESDLKKYGYVPPRQPVGSSDRPSPGPVNPITRPAPVPSPRPLPVPDDKSGYVPPKQPVPKPTEPRT